jgi:hypothetical protein
VRISTAAAPGAQPASETSRAAVFDCYWLRRRGAILALVGHFFISAELEDDDIRVPILGVGREVAISRRVPVLVKAASNLRDRADGSAGSPAVQMIDTSIMPRPYAVPATSRRSNRMAAAAFLRSEIASAEYLPWFQLAFRLRSNP